MDNQLQPTLYITYSSMLGFKLIHIFIRGRLTKTVALHDKKVTETVLVLKETYSNNISWGFIYM